MRIKNLPSIESMNGSQDALIIEQTDGSEDKSRKVSPAQIKQYVLGNSIDDIYSVMGQNGAKNLIPYPFNETTKTVNGITFTDNGDGTITASGTASDNTTFNIRNIWTASDLVELLPNTIYAFSGCPVGGSVSTYSIQFVNEKSDLSNKSYLDDTGTGGTITTTDVKRFVGLRIIIASGTALSTPVTFKPMLRLAADTDNTYQPYAKTNKQLTDELDTAREQISDLTTKKFNTWMPDVYDFDTKVKTLDPSICNTYTQKIGDLTVAYLGVDSGTSLGSFSTMMQLRGFPEGCTRCIGGYIYNSSLESSPRVVQASNVGVYFRPNITGNMSSGFVSALLFFN